MLLVLSWAIGDTLKFLFLIIRHAPAQFFLCGSFQLVADVALCMLYMAYRGRCASALPCPTPPDLDALEAGTLDTSASIGSKASTTTQPGAAAAPAVAAQHATLRQWTWLQGALLGPGQASGKGAEGAT